MKIERPINFKKPIVCTTPRWQRTAWTQNGLMCLRSCARTQGFIMKEVEE